MAIKTNPEFQEKNESLNNSTESKEKSEKQLVQDLINESQNTISELEGFRDFLYVNRKHLSWAQKHRLKSTIQFLKEGEGLAKKIQAMDLLVENDLGNYKEINDELSLLIEKASQHINNLDQDVESILMGKYNINEKTYQKLEDLGLDFYVTDKGLTFIDAKGTYKGVKLPKNAKKIHSILEGEDELILKVEENGKTEKYILSNPALSQSTAPETLAPSTPLESDTESPVSEPTDTTPTQPNTNPVPVNSTKELANSLRSITNRLQNYLNTIDTKNLDSSAETKEKIEKIKNFLSSAKDDMREKISEIFNNNENSLDSFIDKASNFIDSFVETSTSPSPAPRPEPEPKPDTEPKVEATAPKKPVESAPDTKTETKADTPAPSTLPVEPELETETDTTAPSKNSDYINTDEAEEHDRDSSTFYRFNKYTLKKDSKKNKLYILDNSFDHYFDDSEILLPSSANYHVDGDGITVYKGGKTLYKVSIEEKNKYDIHLYDNQGKPVLKYREFQEENPDSDASSYKNYLASRLKTNQDIQIYMRYYFKYQGEEGKSQDFQSFKESMSKIDENGFIRGDCEDYAVFAEEFLEMQGKKPFIIHLPNHEVTVYSEKIKGKYYMSCFDTGGYMINGAYYKKGEKFSGYNTIEEAYNATMKGLANQEYSGNDLARAALDYDNLKYNAEDGVKITMHEGSRYLKHIDDKTITTYIEKGTRTESMQVYVGLDLLESDIVKQPSLAREYSTENYRTESKNWIKSAKSENNKIEVFAHKGVRYEYRFKDRNKAKLEEIFIVKGDQAFSIKYKNNIMQKDKITKYTSKNGGENFKSDPNYLNIDQAQELIGA